MATKQVTLKALIIQMARCAAEGGGAYYKDRANKACAELFALTGEIYSCGNFVVAA